MAHNGNQEGNKNPLGLSENENTEYSNLWDTMKAVLRANSWYYVLITKKLLDLMLVT